MHELGYAVEIVKTLEEYKVKESLTKIKSVTIDVGEATGIVPQYLSDCWDAAIADTGLTDCVLKVNLIRGKARCRDCDTEFIVTETHGVCPKCGSDLFDVDPTAYTFEISEIIAS